MNELPFEKKELEIEIHNPNHLSTINFQELKELQGDLKITTPAKIEKLKKSIIKYGIFVPKFTWIDNGTHYIEDGHQTIKALLELEKGGYIVPPIPYVIIEAKDRKDAGEKLLMINSKFADINPETSVFKDFDIGLEFMEEIEIPELELDFEEVGEEIVEDEVLEPPEETVTQVGDLWLCDKHRVLCGDATKAEDVEQLMGGKKADMVFTSPPYNANSHLTLFNKKKNKWESKNFYGDKNEETDNKSSKNYLMFNKDIFNHFKGILNKNANIFYNLGYNKNERSGFIGIVANAINNGFMLFETIIWEKTGMPIPDTQSMSRNYEFIFLFNQSEDYYTNYKYAEYTSNLWKVNNINAQQKDIKACFPVELPSKAIKGFSPLNAIVSDPFLGSGTTLIAAHQLNRTCYGMEIEPKYVDVICQRFFNLTGIDPVRESDGKKWSELQKID